MSALPTPDEATGWHDLGRMVQRLRRDRFAAGLPAAEFEELVRVVANTAAAFPRTDARQVGTAADGRPEVAVSRNAPVGPTAALPAHWDRLVRTARGEGGEALRALVAMLQAMVLSAEDAVNRRGRPWDEKEWTGPDATDPFAAGLLDLLGPDLTLAAARTGVPAGVLVRNAGLFLRPPTAEGLGVLLADLFAVPVRVRRKGAGLRVRVGPVGRAAFDVFRPPIGPALVRLVRTCRLYLGDGPRFSVEVRTVEAAPVIVDRVPGWDCWAETTGRISRRGLVAHVPGWRCRRIAEAAR